MTAFEEISRGKSRLRQTGYLVISSSDLNIPCLFDSGYFQNLVQSSPSSLGRIKRKHQWRKNVPKYVIERDIPNVGDITPEQVIAISQKSCSVLNKLRPQIDWLPRYVRQGGFPANRVSEVKLVIDPTSAEA